MAVDRREFLKIAGLSTLLGLGGKAGFEVLSGKEVEASLSREPQAGKRWAMVVNMRKCLEKEGCTDCMKACHLAHNVPHIDNPRHEVKWIWTDSFEHVFPSQEMENEYVVERLAGKPFLVLCNHCERPPCVRVCPTKATFQNADGVVVMDYHRCIGCRFCMAGCPYGSRSFNWKDPRKYLQETNLEFPTRMRGVVEKCNFCSERLDKGLQPACVEACKDQAILFGNVRDPDSEVRQTLRASFTIRRKPELGTLPQVYYIV
ncbi:MAG: sulfate reduction electron transfer complex DsrMKJOP subunit DsrO [bacterium]